MFLTPFRRLPGLWRDLGFGARLVALAYVPIIRITGDIAKMVGYPVGLRWRIRNSEFGIRNSK